MLALQLVTAVLGALAVILAVNNRTLRAGIQESREVSQRSLVQAERQLTGCKQLVKTSDEKVKNINEVMNIEKKTRTARMAELNALKNELGLAKTKVEDMAYLPKSLDEALVRETNMKTQLADKDKKIGELAGLQKSHAEVVARENDLKTQLLNTQNDVKAKVIEIAKLTEQVKKAELEKKAAETTKEEKKA